MTDFVELMVGEALLGDPNNTYLYIGNDQEAQHLMMGQFVRRVREEGCNITTMASTVTMCYTVGKVVINEKQRFWFTHVEQLEHAIKGLQINRVFVEASDEDARSYVLRIAMPCLTWNNGDFVW